LFNFTLRLAPSGDDTLDVGRDAPVRQADRMNVGVERQSAVQIEDGDVGVLATRVVVRMYNDATNVQRLSRRIACLQ